MSLNTHHHSAKECKSCHLPITDGQAYKLGSDQWHVSCFKCSKCDKLLGVDSNFLVLGTGALVCSDCSYTCKSCEKKIYDLAILTGDLAYCADCFKCKSCNKPIDDLKYARTSKGLFCMPCHNMLMEKKKKYEKLKKLKAAREKSLKKQREEQKKSEELKKKMPSDDAKTFIDLKIGLMNSATTSTTETPVTSSETVTTKTKDSSVSEIPASMETQRAESIPSKAAPSEIEVKQRISSNESNPSSSSDFNLDDYAADTSRDGSNSSLHTKSEFETDVISKAREISTVNNNEVIIDHHPGSPETVKIQQTPSFRSNQDDVFATPVAIDIIPIKDDNNGFTYLNSKNSESDMVIPMRSPRRSNLSPIRNTAQYRTPELDTPRKKNVAPDVLSPASENRKAHILYNDDIEKEPESFINLDETEEESLMSKESIEQENSPQLLSPIKYNYNSFVVPKRESSIENAGLNIKGLNVVSQSDNVIQKTSKSEIEESPSFYTDVNKTPVQQDNGFDENATPKVEKKKQISGLGRSLTKVLRRGRKQSVGENMEVPSTPDSNSNKSSNIHSSVTPKVHTRTQSDHSFKSFTTPPVPTLNKHNRSISDTSRFESVHNINDGVSQAQKELQMLKAEINSLTLTKATILKDIQTLTSQKKLLELDISDKQEYLKELNNSVQLKLQQRQTSSTDDFSTSNRSTSTKNSYRDEYDSRMMSSTENILYEEPPHFQQSLKTSTSPLPTSTSTQSNLSAQLNAAPYSSKEKRPNFMKKLFGGNSNPTSASSTTKPLITAKSNIGQPMNVRVNEDSLMYNGENGLNEPSGSVPNTAGSGIKASRSSNFLQWRNGNGQSNKTSAVSSQPENSLYSMTLHEISNQEGGNGVPFIIKTCIAEVERRGLQTEGIYRISASTSTIEKLEVLFETLDIRNTNDINKMNGIINSGDVHALAGLLKRYLKKIPDSIIPQSAYDSYVGISKLSDDQSRISQLSQLINNLPKSNRITLLTLTKHLNLVSDNEKWNKMNCTSLATVFAPTLVRHNSLHPTQEIQDTKAKTVVTELLFKNYQLIFN